MQEDSDMQCFLYFFRHIRSFPFLFARRTAAPQRAAQSGCIVARQGISSVFPAVQTYVGQQICTCFTEGVLLARMYSITLFRVLQGHAAYLVCLLPCPMIFPLLSVNAPTLYIYKKDTFVHFINFLSTLSAYRRRCKNRKLFMATHGNGELSAARRRNKGSSVTKRENEGTSDKTRERKIL